MQEEVQSVTKSDYKAPEQGSEKGTRESFNMLGGFWCYPEEEVYAKR
jgi:hypothetical protein